MKKMLNELVRYGKFAFALAFALCCFNASAATVERGGESFPSWVEFMSGVNEGDTVKLTADVTAGNTNAGQNMVKKSITIDLNGHRLYGGFGWWLDCLITVKDSSAGNGIFDLTTNCNGCSFDFTALSPSQIVPGHQLNPSTGKLGCVRFPDGMELADCQTKIKTLADGQHIVLEGQTYVWTSSGWVLEAALTPVADAAANRTAISNAIRDAGWAGTVELSEGIFEIDTRITLNNGVTLKGQGWGKTIIKQTATTAKADGGCFTIDKGARLEGVTVTGGKDSSSPGAGVWIKKGTVSWCCISNNLYQSGTAKAGAGVSFESGEGTIDHSIVVGNELDAYAWGAGIGARSQTGDILIDTCLVYGNVNDKGSAGGVAFDNTTKTGTIRNCTIVGNTANTNVGGVYSNNGNGGKLVLINNIITGNKQGSNEINLFVQNSHLDQEASSNCLVTGSSTGTAPWKDASVVSTLEGKGFTNVDPGFINAAANDYRLGLISAAKGAGADGSGSGVDLANKAFAATPSIGCYEYDSDAALQLGWTAAPMSASGDTICNVGDFVYGYAHKSGGVGTYTVNGVTFKTFNDGDDFKDSSKNPNVTISPDTFDWVFGLGNEGVSGDYGGMLDTAFGKKSVGGPFTFTLKNLQAGEKYLVQVVAHSHGQAYKVTSPDLTKVINVGGAGWTYGGSLIGVFTADTNGEYGFTLNYDPWIMVNAIQVRKLADTPPPSPPSAEWDTEHGTFAKRIAFTASGYEGSGTLENFPVLVRLTESITDFDYDDCDQSKIVFTDASGAILPHEVDTWHTSGESLVWVNVASLSQDATFYMYFDGEPEEVNDATKTWTDSDYAGVWHMNEASGAVVDATGHGLTATPAGNNASTESVAVSGAPTGTGRQTSTSIDKAGAYLKVASDDALNVGDDFTMSGWVKMTAVTGYPRLFGTKDAATDLGWEFEMHAGTFDSITIRGTGSGTDYKKKISSLQNTWRHVVAVFDGTTATLYVDGEVVSDGIGVTNLGTGSKGLGIGNKPAGGASNNFAGDFDECRLLDAVASADWVKAEYQQSAKPEFLVAGAVETHVASTYTVSWTGGVNATVVATVDSTPIDTGDSVEDGKSVVFTVTPNSGYEFATASDGWTKSGANLTKTVTVNGAAVAVVIPGATAIPVVATPGFSPAAGTITEATDVTITCATDGATIYYTTNGDDPTSSSTQYTAPIAVSATTTIKAIAVKSGYLDSSIASATYTYEAPQPTDPVIGSLVITPNGSTAWFSLSGITLGTDSSGVSATSYKVDFAVKNSAGSTIKDGTKLNGQTNSSCSFDVADIPDGTYTGYVTITTDKGKTATKYAEFTIDTSSEEPTIPLGWTAEPMSGPQSIRTDGALLYAYMRGNSDNDTYTINTVPFEGYGSVNFIAGGRGFGNVEYGSLYRDDNQKLAGVTDPYELMMSLNWRGGGGNLVLKNLVDGNTYLVQLILKSTDALGGGNQYSYSILQDGAWTSSPCGDATAYVSGDGWTDGGTLVGVFKAEGSSMTFSLPSYKTTVLNAIQVRDVSPVETVTPGTSASDTCNKIQAAIDAVAPAHGTVHLGEGTFEIDQQLYVTNGVTLAGQSRDKTIIKQTATSTDDNSPMRVIELKGGSTVKNLAITGGNLSGNNGSGAGVEITDDAGGTVSWCTITNNVSKRNIGGGISVASATGKVRIDHVILADNASSTGCLMGSYGGGAIGVKGAKGLELEIDTCLIYDNYAGGGTLAAHGGGIAIDGKDASNRFTATIRNTTIAGNRTLGTAAKGGGLYVGDNVDLTLVNNIFSDNTSEATATYGDANVAFASQAVKDSVAAKAGCCFFGTGSTAETAFGEFAKTGDVGFVGDGNYHLAANSPAIAAGSTIAADRVDLDNVAFVAPPSVGCYEYASSVPAPKFTPASGTKFQTQLEVMINGQGTVYYTTDGSVPTEGSSTYSSARTISDTTKFMARSYVNGVWSAVASATYVKANADAGDYYVSTEGSDFADGLTPETAFRTIEHAVEVANEGQKVTILPGTFEIDETIVIDKAITVTGSGWDKTTIQPTSGTKIRLFILAGGAKLEGVTLTGGNVSSDNGAAAWVKNGTISWCRITNNKSNFGSTSGNGGAAVTFDEGQGTIDHCIVANNTGSTYCYGSVGAVKQSGPVVVDTCLIYQNNAYNGGGVGFSGGTSMGVTVKNCTIVGNTGTGGGGIYFANGGSVGTCKIINTIATGNTAGSNNFDLETSPNATASLLVEKCFFGSAPTANHKVTTSVAGTYTIGTADFTDDYHPAAGWEGVIGAGVSYEGIGETLDGMPFNDPPSIGCYEPPIGFGKVTFAYPAKHVGTATVQLIGLSDGATTANVTFQYGPDSEHLCEPAIVVTNGVVIKTDIVATMTDLNANCEYAYRFTALDDKGQTATRSGVFMTDDWDTLQFSTVKATPTSNSADVSVTIMKLGLGATNATVYVQWGTNYNDLCQAIRISTTASQKQTLTYTITGLKNETDYVVRFSGENDVGDTATRDGAFRTLEKEKLALGEPKVSNLGQTTADIAVTVPTLGENAKSATVTLKWWIDGTTDTNSVVMSSAAVRGSSLSQQLTGLMENTLYRYEIVAVNDLPAPDTETKSVTGGFTTDDPNIGADDYHDSYPTVDNDHVVTYDADSAGNPSTLEPGSPYVVVAKEGYGVSHPAGGKTYWFRNEYDYQYNCSARIGDTYYLFLTDAVTAAQANDKIELLRNNYAISETMQINKKLTIEGNGYAVKVAAPFLDNTGYVNPKCTATPKTVFKIGTGGDVVINDMLVMGGGEQLSTGGAGSNSANEPAIVVTDTGILEMDHVTVKRSQGGLWVDTSAKAHLNACNLVKNARFCGGGFYSKGVLVMENSSLSENRSLSSGGGGAAAENQGLLVMNNCVICNNGSTEYGGAINNLNGGIVYMMNMTMAGNFSSHSSDYGGGIGLHQSSGDLYMLNCILCNNYHYVTTSGSEHIDVSDIRSDSGNNHFLYSVYGVCTGGTTSEFKECFPVVAADQDVFKGYSPFARTYEQNKTTVATIPGPSFDTAPSNEDARYASLTENGSKADVDNEGVYTYFDASAWRSAASNKDVSWLEMAYREEGDTTLTALGKCATTADEEDLVTTYYETAFDPTISDRELGVVGASGFGTHKKTYTLYLLANPVNGGVSDNLNLNGKSYDQGVEVTVVATPAAKCTFLGWYDTKDTTAEPVSTKLAYSFVMDSDKSLLARFSEPSETHRFLKILCEQEAGTHDEFPIEITKTWLMSEFGDEPKTEEQFNVIEAALNEPDPANGLNHKWMNYVLGLKIGDPDGKIWIRGSQNSDSGKLTFSVQELSETKDCGFIVRYRLPKMNLTKDETSYNREGEYINTKKGTFEDAVSDDLQYRIIDMIFIPTNANTRTGKTLNTSFEYMTTVNTAGVMKVTSDKKVEILASPWVGFSPTNNPTIKATDYVKASCLNKDDILYIYDRAHSNYLAWAVQDGQWAQKDTYQIINGVVYKDDDPADIANTNSLPRGMGAWLERSNVKSPIYLYGQVDPSPVTTSLEPGFNLVGNPYPFEYDASQLGAPTGSASDQIVIPTGLAPIVSEYRADFNGGEGAWVHQGYTVTTQNVKGVAREVKKACLTTDGLTLPIGHGFWYNNLSDEQIELVWPKNVNVSEIK